MPVHPHSACMEVCMCPNSCFPHNHFVWIGLRLGSWSHNSMSFAWDRKSVPLVLWGETFLFSVCLCTIDDVKFQASHDFHLMVQCQKNDQEGIGMHCVIPAVESFCINSPSKLLEKWIELGIELYKLYQRLKKSFIAFFSIQCDTNFCLLPDKKLCI